MLNNFAEKEKTFLTIKKNRFQIPKNRIFPKGLGDAFGQKCNFFHYLFSLKIRLEVRFNNVVDRKQNFFDYKDKIFQSPKNCIFREGLTHAFGQKMQFFSLFVFGQNKTRNNAK